MKQAKMTLVDALKEIRDLRTKAQQKILTLTVKLRDGRELEIKDKKEKK